MDRPRLRAAVSPPISPPLSPTVSSSSVYSPLQSRSQKPKSQIPSLPRRILVPTSCNKRAVPELELRPVKSKSSSNRLTRSRADSAPPELTQIEVKDERRWFNCDSRFEVVEDDVRICGYQIFAVEKWIVDRKRATTLLTVYTGDPKDVVTVTALAPASSLSSREASQEWDKVIHELRKDGARPRETDKGIIMVTSLANFRSDYTVVYIPGGDFLAHREQLYVNINLLRMGCSGRSALTLQEPSGATKERFISMFQFGDTIRTGEQFRQTVLELVRLVQCGLSLFDMFSIDYGEQDGLLCDATVEGIQRWVTDIGEAYMKLEPSERVADPSVVSALLSLSLSMRNKSSVIGYPSVPKDPFLRPRQFTRCLAAFVNQRLAQTPSSSSSALPSFQHAYLNLALIRHIDNAYEKYRSSETYKLHRVVLNKIDDLTTATTSAMSSSKGPSHGKSMSLSLSSKERDVESLLEATSDLAAFVSKLGFLRSKDCGASVRYLWTGRLEQLDRRRTERILSDAEEERGKERERERERSESDDEGDSLGVFPWSNKVSKKIENWAGLEFGKTRMKKTSVDLTSPAKEKTSGKYAVVPSVVISRDPEGPISPPSSGEASPISPSASYSHLGAFASAHASTPGIDEGEYGQRVAQFNKTWPSPVSPVRRRAFSWADQRSAVNLQDEVDVDVEALTQSAFPYGLRYKSDAFPWTRKMLKSADSKITDTERPKDPFLLMRKRSKSMDDVAFFNATDALPIDCLQLDIDLCIQCLIMRRRKAHVGAVIAILQALNQSTSTTNEMLRKYHEDRLSALQELVNKCQVVADVEEAVSSIDSASADTDALLYEANFLDVASLWRMARAPRLRVFAIRDRVFGVSSRRRFALGANRQNKGHGRFNRLQRRLDGGERWVDFLGRTESEVEEEAELPEEMLPEFDDESDYGEARSHAAADDAWEGRFQAMNNWLLNLFTKWGRVLGGAGPSQPEAIASGPPMTEKEGTGSDQNTVDLGSDDDPAIGRPEAYHRSSSFGNGHIHRLSTVGEEEEPASTPNTPTTPGLPPISTGR